MKYCCQVSRRLYTHIPLFFTVGEHFVLQQTKTASCLLLRVCMYVCFYASGAATNEHVLETPEHCLTLMCQTHKVIRAFRSKFRPQNNRLVSAE